MKNTSDSDKTLRKADMYARLTIIFLMLSALGAYLCSLWAYAHPYANYPSTDVNYGLQHLGVILIFIELVLAVTLRNLHGSIYWFFWLQLRKTQLTPREQQMRAQVFERSYGYSVFLGILGLIVAASVARYDTVARYDLLGKLVWIIGILLVALPSVMATIHPPKREQ
jgi:hypothetical protein